MAKPRPILIIRAPLDSDIEGISQHKIKDYVVIKEQSKEHTNITYEIIK